MLGLEKLILILYLNDYNLTSDMERHKSHFMTVWKEFYILHEEPAVK